MFRLRPRGGRFRAATIASGAVLASFANAAAAGSFQVNPVQLELPSKRPMTSLSLTNGDKESLAVRVRAYSWTQADGKDVYSPTDEVIASPPIFTVEPGHSQLVRLGLRPGNSGVAYRLFVEEIPRPMPGKVNVALHLNLPLYVASRDYGMPDSKWVAWRTVAGDIVLEGTNRGSAHLQLTAIGAVGSDGRTINLAKGIAVILPGGARQWNIGRRTDMRAGMSLSLTIRGPHGDTQATAIVAAR